MMSELKNLLAEQWKNINVFSYHFYLAFENSICTDYITEKVCLESLFFLYLTDQTVKVFKVGTKDLLSLDNSQVLSNHPET